MKAYEIFPIDVYGRILGSPVYLTAASRERAEKTGKDLLRCFGQKGRFSTRAREYNPLNDPAMRGWVRAL